MWDQRNVQNEILIFWIWTFFKRWRKLIIKNHWLVIIIFIFEILHVVEMNLKDILVCTKILRAVIISMKTLIYLTRMITLMKEWFDRSILYSLLFILSRKSWRIIYEMKKLIFTSIFKIMHFITNATAE